MLNICKRKWDKNKDKLEKTLRENQSLNRCDYLYLVKTVVDVILNDETATEEFKNYNTERITEIDDGEYQGTLLYVIPKKTYQPSDYDYLMTSVGYGSCNVCDTLQAIQGYGIFPTTEEQYADYMNLCLHLIQNMVRPFGGDWDTSDDFKTCEVD